ncbi:MAG: hypothetical protein ACR2RV_18900 [Verrucomicrobiales bacterium]
MPASAGDTSEGAAGAVTNAAAIGESSSPSQDVQPPSAGGWPFDGGETNLPPLGNDVIERLEDLPPVSEEGDAVVPDGLDAIEDPPADQQSTLRGVFLSGEKIDASRVAAHCSELPGIESCAILGDEGKLVALAPDSVGFAEEANRMHRSLLELMAAAGAADSQRLTIRTDRSLVSFFAGDGFAIAVRHGNEGFRPGVQERLAIVARELGHLATGQV